MSHTSERVRREWKIGDAKRDAGLTTPDDIQRFDNISYGEDLVWNLLDCLSSKETGWEITSDCEYSWRWLGLWR